MSKNVDTPRAPFSSIMVTLASFVIIVAGLRAAQPIVVQFLLAAFIAVISAPAYFWLKERSLPTWAAMIVLIVGYVILGFGVVAVVGTSINNFVDSVPLYQLRLEKMEGELSRFLQGYGIDISQETLKKSLNVGALMRVAGNTLSELGSVLADAFLIILTTIFIILEISSFRGKLETIAGDDGDGFPSIARFNHSMREYIVIKTWVSVFTALAVIIWLIILGVDFPLLWGLIAFFLNFIPNLGSILAAIPAVVLALVQLGGETALLTALGYVVINTIFGNVVEPRYMGKGLGLSTLVVFLSLVFWGWALGPIGMLLSVPLTMTLKIGLESRDDTRWLGVILGPEADYEPPEVIDSDSTEEEEKA